MRWGDVRYCFAMAILVIIIILIIPLSAQYCPSLFSEMPYERNKKKKFVLPIPIFLAYLVPLDVDVTGNITAKLCEVWSEFNMFCTLVAVAMEIKKGGIFFFFFISFIKLHETS
jgi:hypothetical protein